jgi:hypothetical protein
MQVRAIMQKSKKIMVRAARGALELMLSVIVIAVFAITIYNYPGYMRTLQMGGNTPIDAKVGIIEGSSSDEPKVRKFEVEVMTGQGGDSAFIGPVQLEFESQKDKVSSEEIFLQPIIPNSAKEDSSAKNASAQKSEMDPMVYALEFNDEDMQELEHNVEISMETKVAPHVQTQLEENEGIMQPSEPTKRESTL